MHRARWKGPEINAPMPASSTKPQACRASGHWLAVPLLWATAFQGPPAGIDCPPVTFLVVFVCVCSVAKSCPPRCDPVDCSPSGSSVQGIPQARLLEWVAISFSRESSTQGSNPHPLHWQADSLSLCHLGKPNFPSYGPCIAFLLLSHSPTPYICSFLGSPPKPAT